MKRDNPDEAELKRVAWAHEFYNWGDKEGWCNPYGPCRKFHYFVRGVSLCGKHTSCRRQQDANLDYKWPDDHPVNCKVCQRLKKQQDTLKSEEEKNNW